MVSPFFYGSMRPRGHLKHKAGAVGEMRVDVANLMVRNRHCKMRFDVALELSRLPITVNLVTEFNLRVIRLNARSERP